MRTSDELSLWPVVRGPMYRGKTTSKQTQFKCSNYFHTYSRRIRFVGLFTGFFHRAPRKIISNMCCPLARRAFTIRGLELANHRRERRLTRLFRPTKSLHSKCAKCHVKVKLYDYAGIYKIVDRKIARHMVRYFLGISSKFFIDFQPGIQ